MHALGYLLFALEVLALATLSQVWLLVRVQIFLRHFTLERSRAERALLGNDTGAHHPQPLAA